MKPSDSDKPFEGEGEEPGELAWNEFDWERYFREQDEGLYLYLAFYEKLRTHPERIDEVARLMGWEAVAARDEGGEAGDEAEATPGNDDGEPYTLHQNPVFIATKAIYLSLSRAWDLIAGDAAKNQAEGNLAGERVRTEVVAREKQRDEREQGDQGERGVVAAEKTPRRAGIAPVDQFEEAGNDRLFVIQSKRAQHLPFGELVERKHHQRERGDAAIGFLKDGIGGGHQDSFKCQVSSFKS